MKTQKELKQRYEEKKQWFIDRIGKKVYRCKLKCTCRHCVDGGENGVFITDSDHACYLTDISGEMGIKYYDTKEEIK